MSWPRPLVEILRSAVRTRRSLPVWLTSGSDIKDHKTFTKHQSWSYILTYLRSPYLSEPFHWQPGRFLLCKHICLHQVPEPSFERVRLASKKTHPAAPCMTVSYPAWHLSPRLSEVSLSEIDFQDCFSSLSSVKNPQTSQTCNGKSSKHWNPSAPVGAKGVSFWRH